jgi:hypothetical protein
MLDFEETSAQIKMKNNETFKISKRRTKHFYSISNPTARNYDQP